MSTEVRRRRGGALSLFGFLASYVKANFQMAMEYRASFITQVLGMVLNDALWVVFWWMFFDRFEVVNGWGVREILLLFSVLTMGFGLAMGVFGNAPRLSRLIAEGHLDYYLVFPKPVLLHILVSRSHLSAWGDVLFGLLVFFLSGLVSWRSFLLVMVGALLTACLMVGFNVATHSLAFWLGHAEGIARQLFEAMVAFAGYPSTIFTGWVKVFLFTVIPAGFVSSTPVYLVTRFDVGFLLGFAAFSLALLLGARHLFYLGLRRYESGNLISLRL